MTTQKLAQLIKSDSNYILDASKCFKIYCVDKSTWGPGEWADEPDLVLWQDWQSGLFCMISRNDMMGHLCGYVGVDTSHPLHGKAATGLHAYYGVNYANECITDPDLHQTLHEALVEAKLWWFGFDCMHSNHDVVPAHFAVLNHYQAISQLADASQFQKGLKALFDSPGATYKNAEFVAQHCRSLAAQLAAMKTKG
jgi:hypothetical protein